MATDRPDPAADERVLRETLRSLATGEDPGGDGADDERIVAEAESALEGVESAAAFADAGGFDRVRAVASAPRASDALRRRARDVLDRLAAYRAAYRDAVEDGHGDDGTAGSDDGRGDDSDGAADHFRSTHDSHIPRAEQSEDN